MFIVHHFDLDRQCAAKSRVSGKWFDENPLLVIFETDHIAGRCIPPGVVFETLIKPAAKRGEPGKLFSFECHDNVPNWSKFDCVSNRREGTEVIPLPSPNT